MQPALDSDKIQKLLEGITIPPAPAAFIKLHEIMQQDEPDIDQVSDAISKDPGLSSLVLKTVNSSYFGFRNKVQTLRQATSLLGLLNISNIVAGLALRRAMEESDGPSLEGVWDSPANVAMVSAKLAKQFGGATPDQAYLLGLFHDVGKVLIRRKHKDYLNAIDQAKRDGVSIVTVEESRYNTNHAVIGYLISRSWSLPKDISQLILNHHNVNELLENGHAVQSNNRTLLAIMTIGELTDHRYLGVNQDTEWDIHRNSVLTYLGIDEWELEDLVEDMTELLMEQED